ncbi:hypothetical protein MKK69_20425 [Methylobacterium sp. J-026]|uniref:hypothetical protein n=1 Tax=Methylobacterium sp. J-026 TaxID=2836624 RepID=UPI001FBB7AB6|nr:hypothetical protein [Methylobacterium sp. J-026]MCJ2136386.1 hypothetical protein [Methylobacterium sp. J-026]
MAHRTVSWTALSRSLHDARPVIAAGALSAKARVEGFARINRRRLVTSAGAFDRSAIMGAAAFAAKAHQERFGGTWAEAMSVCLKAAWNSAKVARHLAAH